MLGRRFARATAADDSGAGAGSRHIEYFSHSSNATVEVHFAGDRLREIKTIPASEYQPEITEDEAAEATEIARGYFLSLGKSRVADLIGFGILAYRPSGKGFFETRVIYVSFHGNAEAPPEYAAWVDLSRQRVIKVREERS